MESHQCQNCKKNLIIEPEDLHFYERINVSPPTFCPECRMIRRFTWRNERSLYHGACKATGKKVITMFGPDSGVTVYDRDYFWGDAWDPRDNGLNYDFQKTFFHQFEELLKKAPLPNLANNNNINSEYVNHSQQCKDCYLIYASHINENCSYSTGLAECKDSLDLYKCGHVVEGYDDSMCNTCNKVFFGSNTENSIESMFVESCKNVSSCLGCVNLKNTKYCIWNKHLPKEEYEKEIKNYDFGSYKKTQEFKERFEKFKKVFPKRYANILQGVSVTGDNIVGSKNCKYCFDLYGEVEDCKYVTHGLQAKDSYDMYGFGVNIELMYEGVDTGINASRCLGNVYSHSCRNASYTYCCHNSNNIFGCVGLKKNEYCILNKQHSKEEYNDLIPRIIEHMKAMPYKDKNGRVYVYGDFFPSEISPFAYNESIAEEYFGITKEEAEANGYRWSREAEKSYPVTIRSEELPDHIKDVQDEITKAIIQCEHSGKCKDQCTTAFRITESELQFYRKHNLTLPRLCPNCRHYTRLAKRTPFKLWDKKCDCNTEKIKVGKYENRNTHTHGESPCPEEFKTAHNPEKKEEIIYCEQCYQAEVS